MASASNVREIEKIPEFTSRPKTKAGARNEAPFKLDGVRYVLRRPKNSLAMQMLSAVRGEDFSLESERARDYLSLVAQFIGYVKLEPPEQVTKDGKPTGEQRLRGRALLIQRLNDPEDDLDLEDLGPVIEQLLEWLYDRNPTKPPASGGRPNRTSRAGGAASRSRRAATS